MCHVAKLSKSKFPTVFREPGMADKYTVTEINQTALRTAFN